MRLKFDVKKESKPKAKTKESIEKELEKKRKRDERNKKLEQKRIEAAKKLLDDNEFTRDNVSLPLSQLTLGIIRDSSPVKVSVDGDEVELGSGWIELMLLLMDILRANNSDYDFRNKLAKNGIIDDGLLVERVYGKQVICHKHTWSVYKLYDSGYYVEGEFTDERLVKSIIKLAKLDGIDIDSTYVHLVNTRYSKEEIKLKDIQLEDETVKIKLEDALWNIKKGSYIRAVIIDGRAERCNNIEQLLVISCRIMHDMVDGGYSKLAEYSNEFTGIRERTEQRGSGDKWDAYEAVQQLGADYELYSDLKTHSIYTFLNEAAKGCGLMDKFFIQFRQYRANEEKKEWQV